MGGGWMGGEIDVDRSFCRAGWGGLVVGLYIGMRRWKYSSSVKTR